MKIIRNIKTTRKFLRIAILIICLFLFSTIFLFLKKHTYSTKKIIKAHPSEYITINSTDPLNSFPIGIDAQSQVETGLPSFLDNFVQGESVSLNMTKDYVTAFNDARTFNRVNDAIRLKNGNYLYVIYKYARVNRTVFTGIALILQDKNGQVLDVYSDEVTNYYKAGIGFIGENSDGTIKMFARNDSGTTNISLLDISIDPSTQEISLGAPSDFGATNSNTVTPTNAYSSSNDRYIVGDVLLYYSHSHGYVEGKVPLFIYDSSTNTGQYQFSLMNLAPEEVTGMDSSGVTLNRDIYGNGLVNVDNQLVGVFNYVGLNTPTVNRTSIQLFSNSGEFIREIYRTTNSIRVLETLNTDETYYFLEKTDTATYLKKYNIANDVITIEKTYSANTDLLILKEGTNIFYFGYTEKKADDFYPFLEDDEGVVVMGSMQSDFTIETCRKIQSDNKVDIDYVQFVEETDGTKKIIYAGKSYGQTFTSPPLPDGYWSSMDRTGYYPIVGSFVITDDYSPLINKNQSIFVTIDDADVKSKSQAVIDQWLITGEKDGSSESDGAIKVYDTVELNNVSNGVTAQERGEWLFNRINKNPLDSSLAIDWKALSYDIDNLNVGPKRVSYFITDSQNQVTTTSRWVNNVDAWTKYDEEYAVHAENFDIPIQSLDSLNIFEAKAKAKMLAWNVQDGTILDDATETNAAVSVNETELQAIQAAKEKYDAMTSIGQQEEFEKNFSEILKPYPLTFTYQNITRKITVFLTGPTTKVDQTKNLVVYADNFQYPLRKAKDLTDIQVLLMSHAVAYAYDHQWTTQLEATKLSNEGFSTNISAPYQSGSNEKYTGLTNARSIMDYVMNYTYSDGKNTLVNDLAQARLYNEEVILHVRQIIESSNTKVVVPNSGYVKLYNVDNAVELTKNWVINGNMNSGTSETSVSYSKLLLPFDFSSKYLNYYIDRKELIPENYIEDGYKLSKTNVMPDVKSVGNISIDYSGENEEYWLTVYIKVIQDPSFYGWSYSKLQGEVYNLN